jgi:hypothetical protein
MVDQMQDQDDDASKPTAEEPESTTDPADLGGESPCLAHLLDELPD